MHTCISFWVFLWGPGDADGGGLLERSPSREHREEEWALRLAEAEEGMVSDACTHPRTHAHTGLGVLFCF